MQRIQGLKERIIEYWDKAGICSFDSSNTSTEPHLASCDNFTESRLLEELLERNEISKKDASGIDIGAGLGRFTVVLARHLKLVHALEPAKSLCSNLVTNCADFSNVKVFNVDFESFDAQEDYNLAVISGVFSLYPDDMVRPFLKKLSNHVKAGGLLLIRDFVIEDGTEKVPSSYIKGDFCYYRSVQYWLKLAQDYNFELLEKFQSRPYFLTPKLLQLASNLGLLRLYSLNIVKNKLYRDLKAKREKGILDFRNSPILNVFMVMQKR
jgi:hypothetical protein